MRTVHDVVVSALWRWLMLRGMTPIEALPKLPKESRDPWASMLMECQVTEGAGLSVDNDTEAAFHIGMIVGQLVSEWCLNTFPPWHDSDTYTLAVDYLGKQGVINWLSRLNEGC